MFTSSKECLINIQEALRSIPNAETQTKQPPPKETFTRIREAEKQS